MRPLNPLLTAPPRSRQGRLAAIVALAAFLTGCASERSPQISPTDAHALIERALPNGIADRSGWAGDIYTGFTAQGLEPTHENICAVVAVIEQESSFHVDPAVPGLPAIAWKEIRARAEHAGVPWLLVHGALELSSPTGASYGDRIDHAKTEKDLSDIYEDFISAVPMGHTLFADHNPIRTRGPMQVNVAFLKQTEAVRTYPYPVKGTMADELFSRRGSVYFGIAHLLGYSPPYPRYLFRFADYNAGQYASRNAAFQNAVSAVSGTPVTPDGALLPNNGDLGSTESAVRTLESRLGVADDAIHSALEKGKSPRFEDTVVYKRVFMLAEQRPGHSMPRALVPRIKLQGPKISRNLTTDWYAHRVDGRFQQCLKR
jgi:Protein of unknown function (DUF1615)